MPSVAVVALSSDSIRHGLNVAQRNGPFLKFIRFEWDALSQSIKSPESSSSASRRSNNIFVRATAARAAILSLLIAQILIEPQRARASSVAPCSHFCSNRQCSTDAGLGFAYLPLEAKCCIRCAGFIRSVDSVGSRIRMQYKLPCRSSPAQANFRSSFHSYRGPTRADDVPVSDDRLVGAPH
ncbi:hypothetical protein EVAR_89785_1 [Eumeta japonica]|uniref:Uncharacterized protein n=1 Tax=Eumeta variegata TaxID=151549 RepID=A0A4C1XFP4_EUMVA|nr:hypothetical protein EVAR_89785_1 [Eumeta japonica]